MKHDVTFQPKAFASSHHLSGCTPAAMWSSIARGPYVQRRVGAAVVELAIVLPLLAFLFALAVDYARVFYYSQTLSTCARNGALYASDYVTAMDSPYANLEEATRADAPAFMRDDIIVTSAIGSDSYGQYVDVTAKYTFNLIMQVPGITNTQTLSRRVRMRVLPASPSDGGSLLPPILGDGGLLDGGLIGGGDGGLLNGGLIGGGDG